MNSPRVVHLAFDLIRGGTEGQCARVAMGLAKRGLPHRVAAFHRRGFFLEAVEAACGPVHEVRIRHLVRPSTLVEILRLAQWLRREKADILHAWDADAAIFGQFAARWAGVKLVTSRRDLGQIYPPHKLALMRRADAMAARVVANAEAVKDHFVAQGLQPGKIEVLPNLLDLADFDAQARMAFSGAARLPEGRRMVVVNRLDAEKNTGLLIEALALVRKTIADAVLVVVGDGPEMEKLRGLAVRSGVAEATFFLGEVNDVPALLQLCEAGALVPTRNEGLSNTILEYMAAGLPVLATDCGGNRELVRDGETGRLLAAGAAAADVSRAWAAMMSERGASVVMGRRGRAWAEAVHAPGVVLPAFAGFYGRVESRIPVTLSSSSTGANIPW